MATIPSNKSHPPHARPNHPLPNPHLRTRAGIRRRRHAWLDSHSRRFDLFINNQWTPPAESRYLTATNPARGEALAQVADASAPDIDAAVTAARAAYGTWSALSPHQRARHLYAIARNIQKHARLLAVLESLDNGKPIREARDIDVPLVARHFYHHAGWAQLLDSEFSDYQPLGVVGQVIPWNFPLLMLAWKSRRRWPRATRSSSSRRPTRR